MPLLEGERKRQVATQKEKEIAYPNERHADPYLADGTLIDLATGLDCAKGIPKNMEHTKTTHITQKRVEYNIIITRNREQGARII